MERPGGGTPASGTGNGTDPGVAAVGSGGAAAPSPGDYEARLAADSVFAAAEAKKHQSRADRAEGALRERNSRIGDRLGPFLDQWGGDQILQYLEEYNTILSQPELRRVVDTWKQKGKVELGPGGSPDEEAQYLSPEDQKIRQLEGELADLRGRLGSQELDTGRQALTRHLEDFFREFPLGPENAEKVRTGLVSQIERWRVQGAKGLEQLRSFLDPAIGKSTVRAAALNILSNDELLAVGHQDLLRKRKDLAALSTDRPLGVASTGAEAPPVFKTAIEALRYAQQNPDRHESQ